MKEDVDITLAIDLEDVTLLEAAFSVHAPTANRELDRRLMIAAPETHFSLDAANRRNVLRSIISINFGLFDRNETIPLGYPGEGDRLEVVHFGTTLGVVVSCPLMTGEPIAPRHLAKSDTPRRHRDEKMKRTMQAEAIRTAYGFATSKMAELSALSPLETISMPLIDADEILDDIIRTSDGTEVHTSE